MECSHWPTLTPTQILIPTPIMTKWVCNPFTSVSVSVLASLNSSAYYNYRPQQSCGQGNIFTPVCHSVHRGVSASVHGGIPCTEAGGCLPQCMLGYRPLEADTLPWEQTPPQEQTHPPRADIPPGADTPREADSGIRSMISRYASYWNAFLLNPFFIGVCVFVGVGQCEHSIKP